MNKKQTIIALILVIALGAIFETSKKVRVGASDGGLNALLSEMDMKPFAQSFNDGSLAGKSKKAFRKRPHKNQAMETMQELISNQQEQKGEISFNENPNGEKVAENTKGKGKKKKKGEDPDDENKDEDGENKEEPTEQELADLDKELRDEMESDDTGDSSNTENGNLEDYIGGTPATPNQEQSEETPLSELIAQWSGELLKFPDYKLLNQFISQRQTGQIPDSVFYPVVMMLLEDSRENINLMGAHALGATPSSRSFEIMITTRRQATFGSRMSESLNGHIQTYSMIQYLPSLKEVLYSSEDLEAIKTAALLVDQAAVRYLPGTVNPPDGEITTLEQTKQRTNLFQGFISILDSLAQSSTDQGVVSAAAQALSHINEYIPAENDDDVSVVSN